MGQRWDPKSCASVPSVAVLSGKRLHDKTSPGEANHLDDLRFGVAATDNVQDTGDSWLLQDRGRREAPETRTASALSPPSLFFPGRSGARLGTSTAPGESFLIQKSHGPTFGVCFVVTD